MFFLAYNILKKNNWSQDKINNYFNNSLITNKQYEIEFNYRTLEDFTLQEIINRMDIRFEFYKKGWKFLKSEKYIYKYIIKKEYRIDNCEFIFDIILYLYKNEYSEIIHKKGRPNLPEKMKEISYKYNTENVKQNNRKKYEYSEKYKKIKNCLFTKEEIDYLISIVNNEILINKIKGLIEDTNDNLSNSD